MNDFAPLGRKLRDHQALCSSVTRLCNLQPIKVQYPKEASPIEFFLADMEAGENELIDPLELLQAYLLSGVICSLFVFPPPPAKLGWHQMTAPSKKHSFRDATLRSLVSA
jgi:hypothetical protein